MLKTVRNPFRLAAKLASAAGPVLARYCRPDCCIAATRITVEVFAEFGLVAVPVPMSAEVWNPAYARRVLQGRSCPDDESLVRAWDEDGSWTVGVGFGEPSPGRYAGHLVAVVGSVPDRAVIVDMSLGQATRPERDIRLGPVALRASPDMFGGSGGTQFVAASGSVVRYRILPTTFHTMTFTGSPDWNDYGRYDGAVAELVKACR